MHTTHNTPTQHTTQHNTLHNQHTLHHSLLLRPLLAQFIINVRRWRSFSFQIAQLFSSLFTVHSSHHHHHHRHVHHSPFIRSFVHSFIRHSSAIITALFFLSPLPHLHRHSQVFRSCRALTMHTRRYCQQRQQQENDVHESVWDLLRVCVCLRVSSLLHTGCVCVLSALHDAVWGLSLAWKEWVCGRNKERRERAVVRFCTGNFARKNLI